MPPEMEVYQPLKSKPLRLGLAGRVASLPSAPAVSVVGAGAPG